MLKTKIFHEISPHILRSLTYWFWLREDTVHYFKMWPISVKEAWRDSLIWDIRVIFVLTIGYPFILPLVPFVAAWHLYNARKVTEAASLEVYNKKNEEYLTIITTLSGQTND